MRSLKTMFKANAGGKIPSDKAFINPMGPNTFPRNPTKTTGQWRIARLSAEEKFSSLRRATLDNL